MVKRDDNPAGRLSRGTIRQVCLVDRVAVAKAHKATIQQQRNQITEEEDYDCDRDCARWLRCFDKLTKNRYRARECCARGAWTRGWGVFCVPDQNAVAMQKRKAHVHQVLPVHDTMALMFRRALELDS